jgi:hypothetical protein
MYQYALAMYGIIKIHILTVLLAVTVAGCASARVEHSVNEENGLQRWHFIDGDIEIELVQRLPDQSRALLMKHEFSREAIEQLALSCMMQTIIRNSGKSGSGQAVSIDLAQWRMQYKGKESGIRLKEQWLTSWTDEDASPEAQLVIRWGMFPTRQEYLPGDYNWGLTTYGIPPGSVFDLTVAWREGGVYRSGEIRNIVCAPDVDRLK